MGDGRQERILGVVGVLKFSVRSLQLADIILVQEDSILARFGALARDEDQPVPRVRAVLALPILLALKLDWL